jgi:CHASE2 domain-containing sensor protein
MAQETQNPFVAVFVDDKTEKTLGPFPYDRSQYAKALKALHQAGAKAVVLKFFLDQAKPGTGDDLLAAEMKGFRVLLQARLDPKEQKPNPPPATSDRSALVQGNTGYLLSGKSGWIPLEKFSRNAADLGFVDIASANHILNIPMVLLYQGLLQPSLELAAVEVAFGQRARVQIGNSMILAGHSLPMNEKGEIVVQLPAKDNLASISFLDVLQGSFDPKRVQGKIVVLGFDAKETPTLPTTIGPLRIHRLFFYSLENLYQQLVAH